MVPVTSQQQRVAPHFFFIRIETKIVIGLVLGFDLIFSFLELEFGSNLIFGFLALELGFNLIFRFSFFKCNECENRFFLSFLKQNYLKN